MAQICADLKTWKVLPNLPGLGIVRRENHARVMVTKKKSRYGFPQIIIYVVMLLFFSDIMVMVLARFLPKIAPKPGYCMA